MSNSNMINGFQAVGTLSGAPLNLQQSIFSTLAGDTTPIYPGDAIKLVASTVNADGILAVARAAASDVPIIGVMSGVVVDGSDLSVQYRKASTTTLIYATTSPDTIYEVQADEAVSLADSGKCGQLVSTSAGVAATGLSGMQLDASTLTTNTATFAFKSLGFVQRVGHVPVSLYNRLLVKINNHSYADQTAGV